MGPGSWDALYGLAELVPGLVPGPSGGAGGRRTRNVVPSPAALSAVIVPPCASAIRRASARPSPWFSVGVEGQLEFVFLGDEDINTGGVTTTGRGGSAWGLDGLLFLRVYFL